MKFIPYLVSIVVAFGFVIIITDCDCRKTKKQNRLSHADSTYKRVPNAYVWKIRVRYTDNTIDTIEDITLYDHVITMTDRVPVLRRDWGIVIASNVKSFKVIEKRDTIY